MLSWCSSLLLPVLFGFLVVFFKPKLSNLASKASGVVITSNLVLIFKEILLSNLNTCLVFFFFLKVRPHYMGRIKEVFHCCLAEKSGSSFTAFGGSAMFACINLGMGCNVHF